MALRVSTSTQKVTLKVGPNTGGSQTATYNPQKTAPVQTTVNPQQTQNPQKTAPASTIIPMATAQQIAQQAERQRQAIEAEQQRQKAVMRDSFNSKISSVATSKASQLSVKSVAPSKISFKPTVKTNLLGPEKSEYDREYEKAYAEAIAEFDTQRTVKKSGFGKFWDKVSFGQDRRDVSARKYAEGRANEIAGRDYTDYEGSINTYLANQASAQERINKAVSTVSTEAEYDALIASEQAKLDAEYSSLVKKSARYDASTTAFGELSSKPLSSWGSKALGKVAGVISDENPLFKYTLGSGDKNIPSGITTPSRIINFIGNINTKDRDIYQYGGGSKKRTETGLNAWQSGYNQRNFNLRPYTDVPYSKDLGLQIIYGDLKSDAPGFQEGPLFGLKREYDNAKTKEEKEAVLKKAVDQYNKQNRFNNSAKELAADPMNLVGGLGIGGKVMSKFKATKLGTVLSEFKAGALTRAGETKAGKAVKWLGKEHETQGMRKSQFIDDELDDIYRKKPMLKNLVDTWRKHSGEIKANVKGGIAREVQDDFINMAKSEIKAFQRYFDAGEWNFKNAGKIAPARRQVMEDLATKYRKIFDDLQKAEIEKGVKTPYRQNYLPQYHGKWSISVRKLKKIVGLQDDQWWFTKERTKNSILGKKKFMNSVSARRYHSAVARKDLPVLRTIVAGNEDIARNIDRIQNVNKLVKRTRWEKFTRVAGAPTRLWKKSVLLGNPAWYANNELFNQMSGLTEGGLGFLKNQRKTGKYLEHMAENFKNRYKPSVARKMTGEIGSNITKETGSGFISKLATKQENRARISLYRTLRQKGMKHDQAIKKLNSALFDYKTKNWERPIKAVVPFWQFQKNVAKRALTLPFTHPKVAKAYNQLDRYQKEQFDKEFESVVPKLIEDGYSEDEIQQFKEQQAKFYAGKLMYGRDKNGNPKYMNTPFNAFSDKQLGKFGLNPVLSALDETAKSEDYFGTKLKGGESSFTSRLISKFPQANLATQMLKKIKIDRGLLKPSEKYIGKAGSEGYGLTKEKQGYDPSKPNYVPSMDPRNKLKDNLLAFGGVPRTSTWDKTRFAQSKTLQKVTDTYFKTDWKSMSFEDAQKAQEALFKKHGITADDFYTGVLSKYDSENTTKIKGMKTEARAQNASLLAEYASQPYGTRSQWAMNKIKELADSGYYGKNPFLYTFTKGGNLDRSKGFVTPEKIQKVRAGMEKKSDFEYAKKTGDWSAWRKKYGIKSQKAKDYLKATESGDWSQYRETYGSKTSPFQFQGKYFKSAESMQKYVEGDFWKRYGEADKTERKKLLAENPEFNKRANWTSEQWTAWKSEQSRILQAKAKSGFRNFDGLLTKYRASNNATANAFLARARKQKKLAYK